MKKYIIYRLIDPTDLKTRYIGCTSTPLNERLGNHLKEIKHCKRITRKLTWLKELNARGLKPIIEEIVHTDKSNAKSLEKEYIIFYHSNGHEIYNIQIVGNGYENKTHDDKFKMELSERMKGNTYWVGKHWSEEAKAKRKLKPAWNKGIKGKKASEETKLKMSNSQKGHQRKGFKWSEEAKLKFKESHAKGWETKRKNKEVICVR